MEHSLKAVLVLFTLPLSLFALGGKPEVVKGQADYEVSGSTEVVRVTDKTILEYHKFDLEKQETTKYEQPSSKSTLLCRVKGKNPSTIRGKLEANGKLLFINPNGLIFSETAHVNVGTLIASTLDIQNDDFLNNRFKFQLSPQSQESSIVNKGRIEAAHNVVFMAPRIVNQGVISAKAGKIVLMGGEAMTLDFDGDEMIQFAVEVPLKTGIIEQAGELISSQVFMKLSMAQKVIQSVLNDNSVIEANHIEIENGVIRLKAGSLIQAKTLQVSGHTIQIAGKLKIAELCQLSADQEIQWLAANTMGHLSTETDRLIIKGPLKADKWTSHVTGKYVLENSIQINNNPLIFDAPVVLNTSEISLSTGDLGGPMEFLKGLEAQKPTTKLTLTAGTGDINFNTETSLDHLDIRSAHNVNTNAIKVSKWTQSNVKGITTIGGAVQAKNEVALQGYALNLAHSMTVDKGPLTLETEGHLKSSEDVVLSASSITHKGPGNVFLGGTWAAKSGGIVIDGNVHLLGDVTLQAPQGEVLFKKGIGGLGGLESQAQSFVVKGDIGRIAYLKVHAEQFAKLSNVGKGQEGIEGVLRIQAKGPLYFEGTEYVAAEHDYRSASSYEFTSGQKTTVFARSMAPTLFHESPINLSENTALEIRSNQGPIELSSVQGKTNSHFTASTPKNQLKIGRIQGIDKLDLAADEMTLQSSIDAGSIHLTAHQPIHISHPLTAQTGDFIVDAHLIFDAPETLLQAFHGKIMQFRGLLSGNTKLTLHAPEAEIILKGKLSGLKKFQQISIHGQKITQHEAVISTGPVHYAAEQIFLGHDIITDNAITFDGPVTLFKNDVIHLAANKYNKGPILLTSTLDADAPSRTLVFQNEKSPTQIKGAIGKKGPLGELVINSGKIIFHDDIGGASPGIIGRLTMKSVGIECKGSTYYAGQQFWNTTGIHLTHEGAVEIKTSGQPFRFGIDAKMELDKTTALAINTQGGLLDLAPIISEYSQPITIRTGSGEAHLKEIGKKVTKLHVEGQDILIFGHLEADQIFMEAENHIEYDMTKGKEIISTALKSGGTITLNSKRSMVGSAEKPLNIETKGDLYVGAKTVAYLEGRCADQNPHVYPPNPPPRTFFNGYEFNYLFIGDLAEDEALLHTLAPDLSQHIPTSFEDGAAIKPRQAPLYYDTSSKK